MELLVASVRGNERPASTRAGRYATQCAVACALTSGILGVFIVLGLVAGPNITITAVGFSFGAVCAAAVSWRLSTRMALHIEGELTLLDDQYKGTIEAFQMSIGAAEAERQRLERDVADRMAELELVNAELERAAALKDDFLANMSHELRTPLNAVLGLSEALVEGIYGNVNERQEKSLKLIHKSGDNLLQLINSILDLAKIEAGKLEPSPSRVHVNNIVPIALSFVQSISRQKQQTVDTQVAEHELALFADEAHLKQILVNLLTNAVKFTPVGGRLGLDVRLEGDEIRFEVWDTGPGIDEEDQGRMFAPFVQLDGKLSRSQDGTGLGLALVKKLTGLNGGRLTVHSVPGEGSRFMVSFPSDGQIADASSPQPMVSRKTVAPRAIARILLAEDNPQNVDTISDYLTAKGYDVLIAHNGEEAIEAAEREQPDIILMDVQMPKLDGLEATRRIKDREHLAQIPVVALTALVMKGDEDRCREAGCDAYVSKPVSLSELMAQINVLCRAA